MHIFYRSFKSYAGLKSNLTVRITMVLLCLITFSDKAFPGIGKFPFPKSDAGYMGLWDWGGSIGLMNHSEHHAYLGNTFEDGKTRGPFLKFHFQESMLSNYFWADDQDKRIKFGIVEKLDLGVSMTNTTKSTNDPNATPKSTKHDLGLVIGYEGGIGAVFKINDKTDVGMNYYFFAVSTFNDPNAKSHRYGKLRFRYSHFMTEIAVLGRKGIDLKYLLNGVDDRSHTKYVGFSYTGWRSNWSTEYGSNNVGGQYFYFTLGAIL